MAMDEFSYWIDRTDDILVSNYGYDGRNNSRALRAVADFVPETPEVLETMMDIMEDQGLSPIERMTLIFTAGAMSVTQLIMLQPGVKVDNSMIPEQRGVQYV